jgi:hypothetical protein
MAGNDRWWAVRIERDNPSVAFELFQASTMTSGGERRRERITSVMPDAVHNIQPTLVPDPGDPDGAALGWTVVTADAAVVRFARARRSEARWSEQAWMPRRPEPGRHVNAPALSARDGKLDAAVEDDGSIMHVRDVPTAVAGVPFPTPGLFPRIAHTAGRTLLAWTSSPFPDHPHVLVGADAGGAGVGLDLTPTAGDQQLLGLVASEGKATVLGVSFVTNRLWARTQT